MCVFKVTFTSRVETVFCYFFFFQIQTVIEYNFKFSRHEIGVIPTNEYHCVIMIASVLQFETDRKWREVVAVFFFLFLLPSGQSIKSSE